VGIDAFFGAALVAGSGLPFGDIAALDNFKEGTANFAGDDTECD
jgi:hypothetical protein